MWEVLEKFGLGRGFVRWIKLLYTVPQACIQINGAISEYFSLTRGTRQGCPLSPLLFALAIEPLAIAIKQITIIRGFERGGKEDKISLYADNALLFLGDTDQSLTSAIKSD